MADEDDKEQKTEEPSEKRMAQAWSEGEVPLAHDLPLVVSLGASAAALVAVGGALRGGLVHSVSEALGALESTPFATLPKLVVGPAAAAVAVCAAAALGSALVTVVQTKGNVWFDRWAPDLSRLMQPGRLTAVFSKQTLTDLGVAAVKVAALGYAAWTGVRGDFRALPRLLDATPADQLSHAFTMVLRGGWRMLLAGLVIAGVDLALTRRRFMERMRVTKEEAKRDAREDSGDPLIKGRRKQRHRELARGRAKVEVPRADALVVNPTHVAIALRYRKDEGGAPRVTAKGKGALAEYMRDLARENAVPIVQDVPLARLLYRKVKVGREVPAATYKAVAAVLAFVYRLTGRQNGRASA